MAAACEPGLDEVFNEGSVRQLMASDGVSEAMLRALLVEVRQARAEGQAALARPPRCGPCATFW